MPTLTNEQIERFIAQGFVRIDRAFPRELADEARAILWKDTGCDPNNRATWTRPVIRLGQYAQEPFRKAANTPLLHGAYDDLVGKGRWHPRTHLGTFPVRFPSDEDPGDAGWHVDSSFFGERSSPHDYLSWRLNYESRGRALLMLFLFSDVSELDAPTRIAVGSHLEVTKVLKPHGAEGLSTLELAREMNVDVVDTQALATGPAGTVYLCHPHLLHAAQPHRGNEPRFIAQPPLDPATPFQLHREDGDYSPVEKAIRLALLAKRL
jgi:hypothetical protein